MTIVASTEGALLVSRGPRIGDRGMTMLNAASAARKSDEPPVAHPGTVPDSDRARRSLLPEVPYKPYPVPELPEALYEPYKKKPEPEAAYKPYAEKPAESEAPYEPYKGM